jgi:hypothetical protein
MLGALITHPDLDEPRTVLDVRPCCAGVPGVRPHAAFIVEDTGWGMRWGRTWVCSRRARVVE